MRKAMGLLVVLVSMVWAQLAAAQDTWVQIEARPTLAEAEERARAYSGAFPNIQGYAMTTGWYAIVMGPYAPEAAGAAIAQLKSDRLIPDDSYVTDGSRFRDRYWPVGGAIGAATEAGTAASTGIDEAAATEPVALPEPAPEPEETQAEALATESLLTQDERELIQTALKWSGHYASAIDGSFGQGTRRSMAEWQAVAGYPATGVLTTRQRAALLGAYEAEQAAFGFADVHEEEAGIDIRLPLGLVTFDRYDPPFVHYPAKDGSGFEVYLISQPGDPASLFALYDLMQTLTIVPVNGPRSIERNGFTIAGQDSLRASYTSATLDAGLIKGFTLVWKPEDTERADRVLEAMKASFRPFGASALDDSLGQPLAEPKAGLLAGIEVRRPAISRSGFYVDAQGAVLTTTDLLKSCARVTIDGTHDADVAWQDATLGLALLKPRETLAPMRHAAFRTGLPRLNAEVAVAGYSYGDALTQPVMTFGTLAEARGLDGETDVARLSMKALPGDVGGPVFDMTGSVTGMLLPRPEKDGRVLPDDVGFALPADAITAALAAQGATPGAVTPDGALAPEDLTRLAQGMTVLVSCWN